MSLGFDKPSLFSAIGSGSGEDEIHRRYLQLWLNQIALIVELKEQNLFSTGQWKSLETDIGYFVENPKFRKLWPDFKRFYPDHFQSLIDGKIVAFEALETAGASVMETPAA